MSNSRCTTALASNGKSTAEDPLLANAPLKHQVTLFPLGFPVTIRSNSARVVLAAQQSWDQFPSAFDAEPLKADIAVSDVQESALPPPPVYRSREHLFSVVAGVDNFLHCDFIHGFVFGWISPAVAQDAAFFRYYFLEVAVLTMLQQRYLAPVHGACVARNGKGVLLCGPSSAGKSTLAYACGRAGWTYISDDATLLVRGRADRYAIGNCHSIRLREGSRTLFPELGRYQLAARANGTHRIELPTNILPLATSAGCQIGSIVFLERDDHLPSGLHRSSAERAFEWFDSFNSFGHPAFREEQTKCYKNLASVNVWTLRYNSLVEALRHLEGLAV